MAAADVNADKMTMADGKLNFANRLLTVVVLFGSTRCLRSRRLRRLLPVGVG
jgi:hypothetical protein